tara:strand:+ start:738 stop:998 length:261 start_codon:yes stop_codon:yes gene_type:complete
MKSVLKDFVGLFFCLLLSICLFFNSVDAQQVLFTTEVDIETNKHLMYSKSIDDLLGPDINFPFNPANHRDGSNPIKRIGKISDDNL